MYFLRLTERGATISSRDQCACGMIKHNTAQAFRYSTKQNHLSRTQHESNYGIFSLNLTLGIFPCNKNILFKPKVTT